MRVAFFACLLLGASTTHAKEKHKHNHKAHNHGHAVLDVAVDGPNLVIALEVPGDVVFGFEHQPKTDAQKKIVTDELSRLADKVSELFITPADAGCTLGAKEIKSDLAATNDGKKGASGHADIDAKYTFKCTSDLKGKSMAIGLFKAWPRLQSLKTQIIGSAGQQGMTLKTDTTDIKL